MSLKTSNITAVTRALAAVAVIGGAALVANTAFAALQGDGPALSAEQQDAAALLAASIASAVEEAAEQNKDADEATLKAAVEKAISDVLTASNADPLIAEAAVARAQLTLASSTVLPATVKTVVTAAVTEVAQTVTEVAQAARTSQQANQTNQGEPQQPGDSQQQVETAQTINLPNGRQVTVPLPTQSQGQVPVYVGRQG